MNKFSNHHLKRNLTDEPALSTNNYIQEDMGHRKRTEDLDWEGPGSRTRAHWPSDAVTKLASGGLILFYFTSFLNISHSFIDIFEYFWHFQIIIWCQLIWGIVLRPMILNLKKNNKYIFFNVMSSKSRLVFQTRNEATEAFHRVGFHTAFEGETSTVAERLRKPGTTHC